MKGSKTVFHYCCDEIIWRRDVFSACGKDDHCILNALYDNKEGPRVWNEGICKKLWKSHIKPSVIPETWKGPDILSDILFTHSVFWSTKQQALSDKGNYALTRHSICTMLVCPEQGHKQVKESMTTLFLGNLGQRI